MKKTKDDKKFKTFLLVFRIILIIIIIYCLIYIFLWYLENKKNSEILNNITNASVVDTIVVELPIDSADDEETETEPVQITAYELDFDKLIPINNSTVGWLTVPNTSINYPVVQAEDNSFYLTHSFDKTRNNAGWIFADYRNKFDGSDKNIIIYGHNRMDSSMFATLSTTQKSYWYNNSNNKYITFTTPTAIHVYEVFSCYTVKMESYYIQTEFENDDSYLEFLNTLKSRSVHDFSVPLDSTDSILTLSTCDATGKSRVVVHAKKIM